MAISRERLQKLPGEVLSELARSGELEIAYLHLQSLRNVSLVAERLQNKDASKVSHAARIPDDPPEDTVVPTGAT